MVKALSNDKRNNVIARLRSGDSIRVISKSVGVSVFSVSKIANQIGHQSTCQTGRPSIITTQLGRHLNRMFLNGNFSTATEAAKRLNADGITVSPDTIRRFLKSANFEAIDNKDALRLTQSRKPL